MYLDHSNIGMTKDQYLEMCEQTGEEIDWDRCPPNIEDFPEIVVDSLNIYNSLGSRIFPDVGYTGKDYSNFDFLLDLYKIEHHNKEFLMEIMLILESRDIKASQQQIKAEYDKIKNKK